MIFVYEMLKNRLKILFTEFQSEKLAPSLLASSMDSLDRLGYLPDDLYQFVRVDFGYSFFISKYPVTNVQYERYLRDRILSRDKRIHFPVYWNDPQFGNLRQAAPVVGVSYEEAEAYCEWLLLKWDQLEESKQGVEKPRLIRLPVEEEWTMAAGGKTPSYRYPWDTNGAGTILENNISDYANVRQSNINRTTLVWMYPKGISTNGVMDMAGNVWELQKNTKKHQTNRNWEVLVGGSWENDASFARISGRMDTNLLSYTKSSNCIGFRIILDFK